MPRRRCRPACPRPRSSLGCCWAAASGSSRACIPQAAPRDSTLSPRCGRSDAMTSMTPLLEGVGIALDSLRANKVRAALTILGVAIGVMVVMVIGALIAGFNKGLADNLNQLGPKTFWVGRFYSAGVNICDGTDANCPWRHNPSMTLAEAHAIHALPSVSFVALEENGSGSAVSYGDKKTSAADVRGRSADWVDVAGGDVYPGRSFTMVEEMAGSQMVVVNRKLADWLFPNLDPIGRTIHIATVPFQVIGVFNPPPSL